MRDQKTLLKPRVAVNTQVIASNTTTNGTAIDRSLYDAESVTFVMQAGVVTAGNVTLLIMDSDDNSIFTAVVDDYLIGLESATILNASNTVSWIGYVGAKRYVRASVVTAGGADLTVGVSGILGNTRSAPTA